MKTSLVRSPAMVAVFVALALWCGAAFFVPSLVHWLFDTQPAMGREGRIEIGETFVVLGCLAGWAYVALRARGRARWVAAAMLLQMVLIFAEEIDWGGVLGAPPIFPERNLRMTLRRLGLITPGLDPDALVVVLVVFLLSPLVPIARYRKWWEGALPVRAERHEAIAAVLAMVGFLALRFTLHELASFELLQVCVYLVLAVTTARIARAIRSS